jgi:hypothetical protein
VVRGSSLRAMTLLMAAMVLAGSMARDLLRVGVGRRGTIRRSPSGWKAYIQISMAEQSRELVKEAKGSSTTSPSSNLPRYLRKLVRTPQMTQRRVRELVCQSSTLLIRQLPAPLCPLHEHALDYLGPVALHQRLLRQRIALRPPPRLPLRVAQAHAPPLSPLRNGRKGLRSGKPVLLTKPGKKSENLKNLVGFFQ